jgi:hypothetical protein
MFLTGTKFAGHSTTLDEMDTLMRQREQVTDEENIAPASGPSADDIISHMSAYMETATP